MFTLRCWEYSTHLGKKKLCPPIVLLNLYQSCLILRNKTVFRMSIKYNQLLNISFSLCWMCNKQAVLKSMPLGYSFFPDLARQVKGIIIIIPLHIKDYKHTRNIKISITQWQKKNWGVDVTALFIMHHISYRDGFFLSRMCGTERDQQHKQTQETNSGGEASVAQTGMMGWGREDHSSTVCPSCH